jgi:tRNA(Ile)-lysidine synthase
LLKKNRFQHHLESLCTDYKESTFLLAISGGVDSMVLVNLFKNLNLKFHVAHVNYHFREEDSDLDEKLVEDYCKNHQIKFHLKDISEQEKLGMKSLQNWARIIRYDFFFKVLKEEKLDFIVTAHHLNDDLETFIINLSRRSGIKGLSGIPRNENQILRPLLLFSKSEIYEFAEANKIEFREDQSNEKNDYLRNKIRNQLTTKILDIFPDFLNSFQESVNHLNAVNHFFQAEIEKTYEEIIISGNENEFILDKEKLFAKPKILMAEIIRNLGFSGLEIEKITTAENGKFFRSSSHEISIKRKEIICKKR